VRLGIKRNRFPWREKSSEPSAGAKRSVNDKEVLNSQASVEVGRIVELPHHAHWRPSSRCHLFLHQARL
jgi:hypothetical protein